MPTKCGMNVQGAALSLIYLFLSNLCRKQIIRESQNELLTEMGSLHDPGGRLGERAWPQESRQAIDTAECKAQAVLELWHAPERPPARLRRHLSVMWKER